MKGHVAIQMRVLIVEDDRAFRKLLKYVLKDIAEVVGECTDGSECVEAYATLLPDIVLMDMQMKKVDGLAATRQIIEQWPDAKVLIVTAHNDESLRKATMDAGAQGYLLKESLFDVGSWLP
jgi:two-component system response regulator DegU